MSKGSEVIFMMFGIVMVSLIILGIAVYYGTADWTWIAQENASFVLILATLGIAFAALMSWLKRR